MSAFGCLSPFLENENLFVSSAFRMQAWNRPALSFPRPPWTRCPFCSTSSLEVTGSTVAPRPSLLRRGVDL